MKRRVIENAHTVQVWIDPNTDKVSVTVARQGDGRQEEVLVVKDAVQINVNGVWHFTNRPRCICGAWESAESYGMPGAWDSAEDWCPVHGFESRGG